MKRTMIILTTSMVNKILMKKKMKRSKMTTKTLIKMMSLRKKKAPMIRRPCFPLSNLQAT